MIRSDLIKALKSHKGPVWIEVQNHNDCFYVQAVKSDLICQMSNNFSEGEETGFEIDSNGYFNKEDKEYG